MRAFKIWNKNRTSSFDLSGLNVITSDIAGLGNRFTNELYDGRIKKHLIHQHNSFEQINLTVNFGVNSNAYQKYREFMNFIQANGRNILVIEYYSTGASRFVDVVLSNASKSQKTGFGVLVETVTFDRLTPYYIKYKRTGTSTLVSNNYMENVMTKITMSGTTYPAGTKIRIKSKNELVPKLNNKEYLGDGVYRIGNYNGVTWDYNIHNGQYVLNGTPTSATIFFNDTFKLSAMQGTFSLNVISGTSNLGSIYWNGEHPNQVLLSNINGGATVNNEVVISGGAWLLTFSDYSRTTYDNYTFTMQLEQAGNNIELDRPIDELNGYTLREVFEGGNHNLIRDIWASDGTSDISIHGNDYMVQTSTRSNFYMFAHSHRFLKNKNYYVYSIFYTNNNFNKISIDYGATSIKSEILSGLSNTEYFMSFKGLYGSGDGSIIFGNTFPNVTTNIVTITKMGHINLDTLGITNLTKEQLDYWFNVYQTLKKSATEYSIPVTDTREIELNETILANQTLIIDSENKIVTLNGANAYQITNKDKSTFLNLPDGDYLIECDLPIEVEYKKWVID